MSDYTSYYTTLDSPIGRLTLTSDGLALTGLYLEGHPRLRNLRSRHARSDGAAPFREAKQQLEHYFKGRSAEFELPLKLTGTPFQEKVWHALRQIPYGTTISYADLARRIGSPKAYRAVGNANALNPVSIIVPCHRVIGAGGGLTGYSGGLPTKAQLLALEAGRALAK